MTIRNELLENIASSTFDIRQNSTIAGYGGIGIDNDVALGTIGATPKILTGFDTALISSPRGVIQNIPNNSLTLTVKGVWTALFKISLTFDDTNAGRRLTLRTFNATSATPSPIEFNYFVGRNTDGVNLNVAIPFEVPAESVGDEFQVQILSSNDTFTNTTCIGATYSYTNNSSIEELF